MAGKMPFDKAMRFASIGTEFALIVVLLTLGGAWLDRHLQWRFPVWTLVGLALGMTGGMYRLIRQARRYLEQTQDGQRKDDDAPKNQHRPTP